MYVWIMYMYVYMQLSLASKKRYVQSNSHIGSHLQREIHHILCYILRTTLVVDFKL